jgi:hypothetical protein
MLAVSFSLLRQLRQLVRRPLLARHNVVNIFAVNHSRSNFSEYLRVAGTFALLDEKHATFLTHSQPNFSVVSAVVINVEHPLQPRICCVEFHSAVFTPEILLPCNVSCGSAGLYGVVRLTTISGAEPISPRSTGSPGAVLRPGARQYINQ